MGMKSPFAANSGYTAYRVFALIIGLWLIGLVLSCGSDGDENDNFGQEGTQTPQSHSPLPEGQIPYLIDNNMPVPSYRYQDNTLVQNLGGQWLFKADMDEFGQFEGWFDPDFDRSDWAPIMVPGSYTAQIDNMINFEGVGWYAVSFDVPASVSDQDLPEMMLRFGAVFLRSEVYLNGQLIGEHAGGYTPFHLATSQNIKRQGNWLVVRADNRITWNTIPVDTYFKAGTHGWWPYGGITRAVTLHTLPDPWVFKLEPRYNSKHGGLTLTIGILARSANQNLKLSWSNQGPEIFKTLGDIELEVPNAGIFTYRINFDSPAPAIWSRKAPGNIYEFTLESENGGDSFVIRFGYRTMEIVGDQFLLNGKTDFWHGINRHSDYPDTGSTETEDTIEDEIEFLQELNVNHIRPGHYPVDERLLDALCDAGITIHEEVPVYQLQFGQMTNDSLITNAAHQLAEIIERDKNNPAILAWSVGNENGSFWPTASYMTSELNKVAKRFDITRPTIAIVANETCLVPWNFILGAVDLIGVNQYYGWYLGDVSQVGQCFDTIHSLFPNKPIFATEFGAGAKAGRHLDEDIEPGPEPLDDHSYSEEFQAWYLREQLVQILAKPYISGVTPWVLADFKMEWNPTTGNPHPAIEKNLKGLMSHDRAKKKISFDLISQIYQELSQLH